MSSTLVCGFLFWNIVCLSCISSLFQAWCEMREVVCSGESLAQFAYAADDDT
jgi:hypothetical protein